MSAIPNEVIDAEIVEDEFKAPVLQDIKYPVTAEALKQLVKKYENVPDIDLDADDETVAEQYKFVRDGQIALAKERNKIEKTRKAIKEPAFTFGKNVDAFAKKLKAIIKDTEDKLKIQRDRVEQNEARKQREAEEAEENRVEAIQKAILNMERLPLEMLSKTSLEIREFLANFEVPTEKVYEEFYDKALILHSQIQTQLNQMADDKELVENAQAIQAQKEKEAAEAEAQRQAQLQKEREEFEEQQRAFQKEREEFEAKQRAVQEEADRKEAERLADELQAKQEAERREREQIELLERKEREKQNKEAKRIAYANAVEDMEKVWHDDGMDNFSQIVDAIQAGQVRHIKWVD